MPSKRVAKIESYALDFVGSCGRMEEAREVSDHLPVVLVFGFR